MSTIDDLRDELAHRAADVPQSRHQERLAGIRRKRTAQRRSIAAAAAGATALAVTAVIALVPGNADLAEPSPPPPATKPTQDTLVPILPGAPVPVVKEKGVEFYETPGLGTLDGYAVGEPGQRRLEFSFIAGSDVLNYDHMCFGADDSQANSRDSLIVRIAVNGHPQTGVSCSTSPSLQPAEPTIGTGYATQRDARIWASYGVVAGSRVHVVAELQSIDGEPRSDPDITIGAGFWSLNNVPGRQVTADVLVPDLVVYEGVNYRYIASEAATVDDGGRVRAPAMAAGSKGPVLLSWGFVGSGGSFTLYPGGEGDPAGVSAADGGGRSEHFLPAGDTSMVRLVAERLNEDAVTLWIALYAPVS